MGLWDSCLDGSLWVLFPSFCIFIICYIIYLGLTRLRSMSRPQHHGAWVSPKLLKTDIATTWTSNFMYSAVISIMTPIQEKMYRQKKNPNNVCLTKYLYIAHWSGKFNSITGAKQGVSVNHVFHYTFNMPHENRTAEQCYW